MHFTHTSYNTTHAHTPFTATQVDAERLGFDRVTCNSLCWPTRHVPKSKTSLDRRSVGIATDAVSGID